MNEDGTNEVDGRTLNEMAEHQTHHCVEIMKLREDLEHTKKYLAAALDSIGVLSTILQRNGLITKAQIIQGAAEASVPTNEEDWN